VPSTVGQLYQNISRKTTSRASREQGFTEGVTHEREGAVFSSPTCSSQTRGQNPKEPGREAAAPKTAHERTGTKHFCAKRRIGKKKSQRGEKKSKPCSKPRKKQKPKPVRGGRKKRRKERSLSKWSEKDQHRSGRKLGPKRGPEVKEKATVVTKSKPVLWSRRGKGT